jgi:Aminoglycoside/hydroxyurea antibiotic resistance kinase
MFDAYLSRWGLVPDGDPIITSNARLPPVLHRGEAAILKLCAHEDERRGGAVMGWWDGDGAARVLAREGDALLRSACWRSGAEADVWFASDFILAARKADGHAEAGGVFLHGRVWPSGTRTLNVRRV